MHQSGDKRTDEADPKTSKSYGVGAEGNLGSNTTGPELKPVPHRGRDGRDDLQHEIPDGGAGRSADERGAGSASRAK